MLGGFIVKRCRVLSLMTVLLCLMSACNAWAGVPFVGNNTYGGG